MFWDRRWSGAAAAAALLLVIGSIAPGVAAQDTVRHGIQRGALGALRVAMADVEAKHKLKYEYKDFNDSTAALLALERGWAKKDQSAAAGSYVNFNFLEKASGEKAADLGKW